jgi:hypothetical protein
MIKLKDILFENKVPDVFVPRRLDDRIERLIKNYIKNGSKGNLDLSDKQLNTLPEILKDVSVGGSFDCRHNNLKSLVGAPSSVNGNFYCSNNAVKFTVAQVRAVCDVKGIIFV